MSRYLIGTYGNSCNIGLFLVLDEVVPLSRVPHTTTQTTPACTMADKEPKGTDVSTSCGAETPHSLVTEDHVRAALTADKGTDARLTAWKIVDFTKKGDNFVCAVTSVEVEYVLDAQSSEVVYVVKINAGKRVGGSDSFNDMAFETETKFYLKLAPEINAVLKEIGHREVNLPKCLHASLEKGKQILFMEDLRQRGYKMFDRKLGMDEAHVTLVVKELARLHAASLLLQNKTPDEDIADKYPYLKQSLYYYVRNSDEMQTLFRDNLKLSQQIIQTVEGYERVTAWIDTIITKLVDTLSEMECGEPKVVCHGDCWINNLLFRYNEAGHPEDVMLIDLQILHLATPANDLNNLFFISLTGDVRKANTEAFLGHYYSVFSGIMEDAGQKVPFTQEQLLKDYRNKNIIGSIKAMITIPALLCDSDGVEDYSKDTNEEIGEVFREIGKKMLAVLGTHPQLKPRFVSVFDEIMELGMIP